MRILMVVAFIALVLGVAVGQSIPLDPRYRVGFPQAPPPPLPSGPAVGAGGGETMQLPLAQGWNVITLPFSALQKAEGFTRAWLEIDASSYVAVDPVHSPGSIDCGRAFIAYADAPGTAYLTGIPAASRAFSTRLSAGWNLLGCPSTQAIPLDGLCVTRAGGVSRRWADTLDAAVAPGAGWIYATGRQYGAGGLQDLPLAGASLEPGRVVGVFVWADCEVSWQACRTAERPRIDSVAPNPVVPGETVVISGSGFGVPGVGVLTVNGQPVQPEHVVSWAPDRVVVRVPPSTQGGRTGQVAVLVDRVASNGVAVSVAAPKVGAPSLGALEGQVVDDRRGPIAGAQVALDDGQSSVSGPDGRFRIPSVPAGQYLAYITRIGYKTGTGKVQIAAGQTRTLLVELPPAGGGSGGTKSVEPVTRMRVAGYPFTYDGRRYRVKKIVAWEYGNQDRHWENTWWTDNGDTYVELACDPVYMGRSYRVIVTWVDKLGNERNGGGYPEIWAHDQRVTYEHP